MAQMMTSSTLGGPSFLAPTTDEMNPQWAQFFDMLNKALGPTGTISSRGHVGQSAPPMGSPMDTAGPNYDPTTDPTSDSYDPVAATAAQQAAKRQPLVVPPSLGVL